MNGPIVKPLKVILDDRGYLSEILRVDDPNYIKFGQLYLSTITPGTIKGFHIHRQKSDFITCVVGQIKFVVIQEDPLKIWEYHLSPISPKLVIVPPNYWHGWMCVGNTEAILINVTTEPYTDSNKDEERMDPINNKFGYTWQIKHG